MVVGRDSHTHTHIYIYIYCILPRSKLILVLDFDLTSVNWIFSFSYWVSIIVSVITSLRMMTSSNDFRVTGPLWGFPWSPVDSPHKGQWRGALMLSLICTWTNGWANNRDAGDLKCNCAHHDVTVMMYGSDINPFIDQIMVRIPGYCSQFRPICWVDTATKRVILRCGFRTKAMTWGERNDISTKNSIFILH